MAKRKIIQNWLAIEKKEIQLQKETKDPDGGFLGTKIPEISEELLLVIPFTYKPNPKDEIKKFQAALAEFCPFTGRPLYEEYEEIPSETQKDKK